MTWQAEDAALKHGATRTLPPFSLTHLVSNMPPQFTRKNIRLTAQNYRGRRSYFVTLCFASRRRFGTNARLAHRLIVQLRKHSSAERFGIHAYCLMPDHLHFLAEGTHADSDLLRFVESFKQNTAFRFRQRTRQELWQFKYYDHILRKAAAVEQVAWYIWLNSVRKGICQTVGEYPHLGAMTEEGRNILESIAPVQWLPPWKV